MQTNRFLEQTGDLLMFSSDTPLQIEVYDNEDGSYTAQCPICGAVSTAWDDYDGAAHDIMSHIHEEHVIEEEY